MKLHEFYKIGGKTEQLLILSLSSWDVERREEEKRRVGHIDEEEREDAQRRWHIDPALKKGGEERERLIVRDER